MRNKYEVKGSPLPVHVTDMGRASSKRPKDVSDCAVRSLLVVCAGCRLNTDIMPLPTLFTTFTIPYDAMWDLLRANGRKWGQGFDLDRWLRYGAPGLNPLRDKYGLPPVWFSQQTFPSKKGTPRMTLEEIPKRFPYDDYLVELGGHVLAMCEGRLWDDHKDSRHRAKRCVYSIWSVLETPGKPLWRIWRHSGPYLKLLGVAPALSPTLALDYAKKRWPNKGSFVIEPFTDQPLPLKGGTK